MTAKALDAALGIIESWSVTSAGFDESARVLAVLIDFRPGNRLAVSGHEGVHPVHESPWTRPTPSSAGVLFVTGGT